VRTDDWYGCYRGGWGRNLVAEAFSHPAKVAFGLSERIFAHMREEKWITPGSVILDPFAGIGGFALQAMLAGCEFIGVELEPKFVALAAQNIALWNSRYAGRGMPGWGSAVVLQGDSRNLLTWQFAGPKVEAVVGSPPYAGPPGHDTGHPRLDAIEDERRRQDGCARRSGYGSSPSNLGNMAEGDVDAVISSPPYSERHSYADDRTVSAVEKLKASPNSKIGGVRIHDNVGTSPGQLGQMQEGAFEACVSSPPYEGSLDPKGDGIDWTKARRGGHSAELGTPRSPARGAIADGYGAGADNLGNSSGDTFWSASRQILEQVFLAVRPGGHAVWVVKAFVRKGKLVDFPGQWRQLCEAVGFRCLHVHRAWLLEDNGTQQRTDGGETRLTKERKSFFRRLAEKKGSPRIDWEEILCFDRP